MRLTCPTCAAAYELPDDQLPAGGSHVQCSSCHTRWFARARPAEVEPPSEEEIIARLATRARPAPSDAPPDTPPARDPAAPTPFPTPPRPPPAPADAPPRAPAPPAPRPDAAP
ncbi:zinc-ribbon domain-containing protein, partial [Amaricoccus sp.]|uniref:zinc finger domain-containing protein n=1 Tax=Amaricoccus sp. TaxID=1872485 RepID=UPI0025C31533